MKHRSQVPVFVRGSASPPGAPPPSAVLPASWPASRKPRSRPVADGPLRGDASRSSSLCGRPPSACGLRALAPAGEQTGMRAVPQLGVVACRLVGFLRSVPYRDVLQVLLGSSWPLCVTVLPWPRGCGHQGSPLESERPQPRYCSPRARTFGPRRQLPLVACARGSRLCPSLAARSCCCALHAPRPWGLLWWLHAPGL